LGLRPRSPRGGQARREVFQVARRRSHHQRGPSSWLAVDFFVLNLLIYSAVFVPLERLFPCGPTKPSFAGTGSSTCRTSS
jgi:hypothetical protein